MTTPFPFETWTKPGRDAFEFWISFFPTAPLFGVEWRLAGMADPASNPFLMSGVMPGLMPGLVPGLPGMRAAAAASHPGELDSPAAADEGAAKPVTRTADLFGDAARDVTRLATETGKAAARTANATLKTGADTVKQAVDAQDKAVDVAEEAGRTARKSTETAVTAAEDAATTARIATEETERKAHGGAEKAAETTGKTAGKATETTGKAAETTGKAAGKAAETTGKAAGKAAETTGKAAGKGAERTAEAVDKAVAAAPKPKMLLDKRPDQVDDMKAIKGIGPDLERQLNRLGLYRFDQLAKMSDTDVAWIDANITRFKGRCYRDDWVGQAKARLSK